MPLHNLNNLPAWLEANWPILALLAIWVAIIKGIALWRAARSNHRGWFVVLLVLNTFGIVELIYLFWINPDKRPAPPAPGGVA